MRVCPPVACSLFILYSADRASMDEVVPAMCQLVTYFEFFDWFINIDRSHTSNADVNIEFYEKVRTNLCLPEAGLVDLMSKAGKAVHNL